jgi:GxxExxY protein
MCYVRAMRIELEKRGHSVAVESPVDISYKGVRIGFHRIDLLVDGKVVVEVKSSEVLPKQATNQLLHYLKGTGLRVGLLLHFGPEAKFYRRVL